jgi:endonuclease YncB( thermonuclease family)
VGAPSAQVVLKRVESSIDPWRQRSIARVSISVNGTVRLANLRRGILAGVWLTAGLMVATPVCAQLAPVALPCAGLEAGPVRTVSRVLDAETVALDDGSQLRLVGILAPRAFDVGAEADTWPPELEAREELKGLILGRTITVAFGGQRVDRYGRLLGHVVWSDGGQTRWVQRQLLERGMARAFTQNGNRACAQELLKAESGARAAGRGLWAQATYQVRRAGDPLLIRRYRATFQVIEGPVVSVASVRGVIYLNFAADWRRGFSASLRRRDQTLLGIYADDPSRLEGKSLRVRGWVRQRRSLGIDVSQAGDVEVIEAASAEGLPARDRARADPAIPPIAAPNSKPPSLIETGR